MIELRLSQDQESARTGMLWTQFWMLSDVLSAPPLGQMQSQVLAVAELHDVLVDQSAESDYNESCT